MDTIKNKNAEICFTALMRRIGLPVNMRGYSCLKYAVLSVINGNASIDSITKELYPQTGENFGISANAVEHAIRACRIKAFAIGDKELISRIFDVSLANESRNATNSEFIYAISQEVVKEMHN